CRPAACQARTNSSAVFSGPVVRPTQPDTGRASDSMSLDSGGSATWCQLAWSPTTLTTGECARRALCRLAIPLAKPGPKCRRVIAGRPSIRAYPAAAPVTTPSCKAGTGRAPGASSNASTRGIAVVPGLAKQTSTPAARAVAKRLSEPFTAPPREVGVATGWTGELAPTAASRGMRQSPEQQPGRV